MGQVVGTFIRGCVSHSQEKVDLGRRITVSGICREWKEWKYQ